MTQEEKRLLLQDLSARLPYGVKGTVEIEVSTIDGISASIPYGQWEACTDSSLIFNKEITHRGEEQEPYLYSM